MPAGLNQVLGDADWQLSHGEKSLVYLARALLQGAELLTYTLLVRQFQLDDHEILVAKPYHLLRHSDLPL